MKALFARNCPMLLLAGLAGLLFGAPEARADQWNYTNNPQRFQLNFDYNADQMPLLGAADRIPWALGYVPQYGDEPGLTALVAFDQAVYGWGAVSIGDPDGLGPAAGEDYDLGRAEQTLLALDSDPLEDWWGLSWGWAAAAVMEPEPTTGVSYDGFAFTPDDVKALAIRLYDRAPSVVVGESCPMEGDKDACEDTNAGSFFVVVTNMLGRYKSTYAEDGDPGPDVSFQVAFAYQIVEDRVLSEDEAVTILGHPGASYQDIFDSPDSEAWRYVKMNVDYISESSASTPYTHTDHYEMVLEIGSDGYVIGGEWVDYPEYLHPDFVWIPLGVAHTNTYLVPGDVEALIDSAKDGPRVSPKLADHVAIVARATATLVERIEPADLPPHLRDNLLRTADSAIEALDASTSFLLEADGAPAQERRVLGLRAAAQLRHAMARVRAFEAEVQGAMSGGNPRMDEDLGLGLLDYAEQLRAYGDEIAEVLVDMARSEGP